jgi:hypothetical protein
MHDPQIMLSANKTYLVSFGSQSALNKVTGKELSSAVDSTIIKSASTARDLGILLDSKLTVMQHVSNISSSCFHCLKQVRLPLGPDITAQLVSTLIFSRIDYSNALFAGCTVSTLLQLQHVENRAARLLLNLGSRDHASGALKQFH